VIEILKVCFETRLPGDHARCGYRKLRPAMPLAGGCVMHLRHMNDVRGVHPGRVVVEPGCLLKDLDAACIADSGQEIRMFSSTWATATIAGLSLEALAASGPARGQPARSRKYHPSTGRDDGSRTARSAVSREELPRVSHAYGTNGIITAEVEIRLHRPIGLGRNFLGLRRLPDAAQLANDLGNEDGILIKLGLGLRGTHCLRILPTGQTACERGGQTLLG
jgi:FAD/FMN-containing dehydrogenase